MCFRNNFPSHEQYDFIRVGSGMLPHFPQYEQKTDSTVQQLTCDATRELEFTTEH